MAVDIRAEVSCSLGTLISGSFADDYLQGNGLIKTRGEVVLSGTQTPAVGTQVSFAYTKDGNTYTIPRVLRVLSSFADPFRRTTTVQLGCKLTYLEKRKPPLSNPNSKEEHSAVPCYVYDKATLPISASYVLTECLSALSLSSGTIPLTNTFSIEEFDLTPGYVQVISDLLQSEGYVGYLDSDEELQFIDLTDETGTGPLIGTSEVIDLGPIGVGDLAGESVVVRYNSLRLKAPEDLQDDEFLKRRWEVEEVFGQAQEVSTSYENAAGTTITVSDFFYPYTFSGTLYDVWDRKVESVTLTTASSAEVNGRWASDAAKTGVSWNRATNRISHEVVQYAVSASVPAVNLLNELQANGATSLKQTLTALSLADSGTAAACVEDPPESYDQILSQTSTSYFSELELAGSLNIDSYTSQGNLISFGTVADLVNSQTTIGYEKDDASGITKTVTQQWLSRSQTVSGQQDLATLLANSTETDTSALIATLLAKASPVVYQNSEVQLHTQLQFGLQRRPSQADRNNTANLKPNVSEQKAELEWVMGSPTSTAVTEFSLPYAPDDQIGWTSVGGYTSTASDAAQKAQRYGRIQNKLLLGNRNGTSIQLAPEQLPKRPFDPLYLQAGGFTGAYRVNGTSWAFDANGIVASVDALLWGAVSASTGTSLASSWIPLAPNTTTLPLPYAVSPGALDPETGVTFAAVISPDTVLVPYRESVLAEGVSRSTAAVAAYPYALDRGTTEVAAVTRSRMTVGSRVVADFGALTVNGTAAGLTHRRALIGAKGTFALTGLGAGNVRDYRIGTNYGSFALAGQASNGLNSRKFAADSGAFNLVGGDTTYLKGTVFNAAAGSFAIAGQAAERLRGIVMSGAVGTFTLTGQAANFTQPDPYASSVVLLLHMNGTNNSTSFVDNSTSAKTVTANGNAKISTAQAKYGSASGLFDGNGDYLSLSDSDDFHFGSGDFTIETWYRRPATTFTNYQNLISQQNSDLTNFSFQFFIRPQDKLMRFTWSTSGNGSTDFVGSDLNFDPALNTWYHLAVTRSGSTFRLFVDGVQVSTKTASGTPSLYNSTASPRIGGWFASGWLDGYLDDFRITKGAARYTAAFTPPTSELPNP